MCSSAAVGRPSVRAHRRARDDRRPDAASRRRHPVRHGDRRACAHSVGLNIIGMRRRGFAPGDASTPCARPIGSCFSAEDRCDERVGRGRARIRRAIRRVERHPRVHPQRGKRRRCVGRAARRRSERLMAAAGHAASAAPPPRRRRWRSSAAADPCRSRSRTRRARKVGRSCCSRSRLGRRAGGRDAIRTMGGARPVRPRSPPRARRGRLPRRRVHRRAAAAVAARHSAATGRPCGCCRGSIGCSAAATIICCRAWPHLRGAWLPRAGRARGRARNPRCRQACARPLPAVARAISPTSRAASRCCDAIGAFDIGQAVVVADGRVLAVEAAEGTDGMLARVAELRRDGRITLASGVGVLVKAPKPRPGPALRSARRSGRDRRGACRRRGSPASPSGRRA